MANPFKTCTLCGHHWHGRDAFLADPDLDLLGYQPNMTSFALGFFLFTHASCGMTFSVRAGDFADLHHAPVFVDQHTATGGCSGLCQRERELDPCPARCECSWVREILGVMHRRRPGSLDRGEAGANG